MARSLRLLSLLWPVLSVSALVAQNATGLSKTPASANLDDPQSLLSLAMTANNLDNGKLTPWHLTASYESYNAAGKPVDSGTYEEWRLAPDRWKRSYKSATFTQTEYESDEAIFFETDAGAPPWPLSLIGKELVHPMPDSADADDIKPELRPLTIKPVNLNCVMLSQPYKQTQWPLGLFPTYCFGEQSAVLRFALFDGSIEAVRNQFATFRGVYVAKDIELTDEKAPLLKIKLLSFASMTPAEAADVSNMPGFAKIVTAKQVDVPYDVMKGSKIGGPNPTYPLKARQNRVQGTVELSALIGTDGRVHQLRVLSSPDELLSISALAAVQRWVYKPYTLQGRPVRAKTKIKVIYNLSPSFN